MTLSPWGLRPKSANPRAEAALAVVAVLGGSSLDDAFAKLKTMDARDIAFCKALAYGVLRERRVLGWIINQLVEKPLPVLSPVHALVMVGLQQMRALRTAPHAAVGETVDAVALLGEPKARGLVNALLRRYQREAEELEAHLPDEPSVRHSYPDWLATSLRADWGTAAPEVMERGNIQAPLTLRINRRTTSMAAYKDALHEIDLDGFELACCPDALRLSEPRAVESLPGFSQGWVSVQDASAQLAAEILAAAEGDTVLDACSAPGGKAAHALERANIQLTALDIDGQRLQKVVDNFTRLGVSATVKEGDACTPDQWWDGRQFDRILIDAPCSGTGVIRRHPDIKWLRRSGDIARLVAKQNAILAQLWPTLKPGGTLVYAVCSILKAEGETVIVNFLANTADAKESVIDASWGEACTVGRRIAPGGDFDGFYYARLVKTA